MHTGYLSHACILLRHKAEKLLSIWVMRTGDLSRSCILLSHEVGGAAPMGCACKTNTATEQKPSPTLQRATQPADVFVAAALCSPS